MNTATIKVCKYHKYDLNLITLLSMGAFYSCPIEKLNDPLEGHIKLTESFLFDFLESVLYFDLGLSKEEFGSFYTKRPRSSDPVVEVDWQYEQVNHILNNKESEDKFVKDLIKEQNFHVVSFSKAVEENRETLMWAHYSAGFTGVRMTFEFPVHSRKWKKLKLEKVKYYKEIPPLERTSELKNLLLKKYIQWQYEKEYRIITKDSINICFDKSHLKEIAFGVNMSLRDITALVRISKKLGYECNYFKMKITKTGLVKGDPFSKELVNNIVNLNSNFEQYY